MRYYKLESTITKKVDDAIPSYYPESFPDRCNEVLLKITTIPNSKNGSVIEKLNLNIKKLRKTTMELRCLYDRVLEKPILGRPLKAVEHQLKTGTKTNCKKILRE